MSIPQEGAALVGVDWGTTNVRVMKIAAGGRILEARSDPRGAGGLAAADFPRVLDEIAGDWSDGGVPVLVAGMAGARGRWREAAYVDAPCGPEALARYLTVVSDTVRIVPGVALRDRAGLVDVMRGEETQGAGLTEPGCMTVVTPGTHSKWIQLSEGVIVTFRTFMTGELFAALRDATLLGQGMGDPGVDPDAFAAGVRHALGDRDLSAAIFSVRIGGLDGRLDAAGSADYLSGLLIGSELAAQGLPDDRPITVVGSGALVQTYLAALSLAGFSNAKGADGPETIACGLWRIHEASTS